MNQIRGRNCCQTFSLESEKESFYIIKQTFTVFKATNLKPLKIKNRNKINILYHLRGGDEYCTVPSSNMRTSSCVSISIPYHGVIVI